MLLFNKPIFHRSFLAGAVLFFFFTANAQGFLHTVEQKIVDGNGKNVLLRSIGLGGWMVQEGYMLRLDGGGQQYRIKEKIGELIGKEATASFYQQWRNNHVRKTDIDSLKAWGFNAIRVPIHFNLFTLPVEKEPVKGKNTWLPEGFRLLDSLLGWCRENRLYIILDLHAAPGGQGNDLNIADRDPSKPSLWESREDQLKTIALWERLAQRYANEQWIGGYDLLNEPNWSFSSNPNDNNGIKEQNNEPLWNFFKELTTTIRKVDPRHLLIVEGNGWGNNYAGLLPTWDKNLCLSFHKYWNYNDQRSIKNILELRQRYNVPIWLGESGENSNVWFREAISLAEQNNIGWSWWPLKKIGINNPLEVKAPEGYETILNYWKGAGPKPGREQAKKIFFQLAENLKLENCRVHKDVIDALFRQVHSSAVIPFVERSGRTDFIIYASDYDLGRSGSAYFDLDSADYHISTGGSWAVWNKGRVYRNDGVDIALDDDPLSNGYKVFKMETGEWMNYSFSVPSAGNYDIFLRLAVLQPEQQLAISVNGDAPENITVNPAGNDKQIWQTLKVMKNHFSQGNNSLRIYVKSNQMEFGYIQLKKRD